MESMRKLVTVPLSLVGAAAAGLAYAHKVEPNLFRLRRYEVPVLPRGVRPFRILQVSDIHMIPEQYRKVRWLRSLAALEPDFVVNTGDNLSHPDGVGSVLDALEPLMELPGAFVMGSNDYLGGQAPEPDEVPPRRRPEQAHPRQGPDERLAEAARRLRQGRLAGPDQPHRPPHPARRRRPGGRPGRRRRPPHPPRRLHAASAPLAEPPPKKAPPRPPPPAPTAPPAPCPAPT